MLVIRALENRNAEKQFLAAKIQKQVAEQNNGIMIMQERDRFMKNSFKSQELEQEHAR
jgi:hypothetical protein